MELNEQERAFVEAFIVKDKRERYLQLLGSPKRRRDILDRFNHFLDFDPNFAALVSKEMRTLEKVTQLLRRRGAPEMCHVIVERRTRNVPCHRRAAHPKCAMSSSSGAPEMCHVIVDSLAIDGEDLPLKKALESVIAHDFGSVLCCLPGRLAFHKPEAIEQAWYIFEKK